MYFLASFDLMPISASCSAGVCTTETTSVQTVTVCLHLMTDQVSEMLHPAGLTYFESPERVAGVGASVEEAAGLGSCTQQILCRKALSLGDVTDLTERHSQRDKCKPCVLYLFLITVFTVMISWGPSASEGELVALHKYMQTSKWYTIYVCLFQRKARGISQHGAK